MTELQRAESAEEVLNLLGHARAHMLISVDEIERRTREVLDHASKRMLATDLGQHFAWDSLKSWGEIEEELRAHIALAQAERGPLVALDVLTHHADPVIPVRHVDSDPACWVDESHLMTPPQYRREVLNEWATTQQAPSQVFMPPTPLTEEQVAALRPVSAVNHFGRAMPSIVPGIAEMPPIPKLAVGGIVTPKQAGE